MSEQDNATLERYNSVVYLTLDEYATAQDITNYYLYNTSGLGISSDVISAIQSSSSLSNEYWNEVIVYNTAQQQSNPVSTTNFANEFLKNLGSESAKETGKFLKSYEGQIKLLSSRVVNEVTVSANECAIF